MKQMVTDKPPRRYCDDGCKAFIKRHVKQMKMERDVFKKKALSIFSQ